MSITPNSLKYTDERSFDECSQTVLPMGRQDDWRLCVVDF